MARKKVKKENLDDWWPLISIWMLILVFAIDDRVKQGEVSDTPDTVRNTTQQMAAATSSELDKNQPVCEQPLTSSAFECRHQQ